MFLLIKQRLTALFKLLAGKRVNRCTDLPVELGYLLSEALVIVRCQIVFDDLALIGKEIRFLD